MLLIWCYNTFIHSNEVPKVLCSEKRGSFWIRSTKWGETEGMCVRYLCVVSLSVCMCMAPLLLRNGVGKMVGLEREAKYEKTGRKISRWIFTSEIDNSFPPRFIIVGHSRWLHCFGIVFATFVQMLSAVVFQNGVIMGYVFLFCTLISFANTLWYFMFAVPRRSQALFGCAVRPLSTPLSLFPHHGHRTPGVAFILPDQAPTVPQMTHGYCRQWC